MRHSIRGRPENTARSHKASEHRCNRDPNRCGSRGHKHPSSRDFRAGGKAWDNRHDRAWGRRPPNSRGSRDLDSRATRGSSQLEAEPLKEWTGVAVLSVISAAVDSRVVKACLAEALVAAAEAAASAAVEEAGVAVSAEAVAAEVVAAEAVAVADSY